MQEALFTVAKLEDLVPADHPLRPIRLLVNKALSRLNGLFNLIYADTGHACIAPKMLLRAMLIQVFFAEPRYRHRRRHQPRLFEFLLSTGLQLCLAEARNGVPLTKKPGVLSPSALCETAGARRRHVEVGPRSGRDKAHAASGCGPADPVRRHSRER